MSIVKVKVQGVRELNAAMKEFDKNFRSYDAPAVVRLTANKAAGVARRMSPPGKKSRTLIDKRNLPTEAKSKRTDTVRYATHFVKFYRQSKRPFFVPITISGHAHITDDGIAPPKGSEDYAKFDADRKRTGKRFKASGLKYQQTRASTAPGKKGGIKKQIDSPADVAAMRKISRRGLAGELWAALGNKAFSKRGNKIPIKEPGVGKITHKNRDAIKGHENKWSRYLEQMGAFKMKCSIHNKVTYMQKAYGNFEPYVYSQAARALRGMTRGMLEDRAKKAQQKFRKV